MDTNIKSRQIANMNTKFRAMCEKVMQQFSLMEDIFRKMPDDERYEKIRTNETDIDRLDNEIRTEFIKTMLFSPRAGELRKLITNQDITNFLEAIGDSIVNMMLYPLKKIDMSLPEFEYFQLTLEKMLLQAKKMVNGAIFSFCYEDSDAAYKVIKEDDIVDGMFDELSENVLLSFQDTPLSEQELSNIVNISNIAAIIEHIGDIATHIAEASIFMIEGKEIRHRLLETN